MHFRFILLSILLINIHWATAQEPADLKADKQLIQEFYEQALTERYAYNKLVELCTDYGHRLSGSDGSLRALAWGAQQLEAAGADTVYRMPVLVPHWERGAMESFTVQTVEGTESFYARANGGSVPTTEGGLRAPIIMYYDMADLEMADSSDIEGKIVFINQKFDHSHISTGSGYGAAVIGRVWGGVRVAERGGVGCIIRSASSGYDNIPHTGVMRYEEGIDSIPSMALGNHDADRLEALLVSESVQRATMNIHSRWYPHADSYNVIGELRGSTHPDSIITLGGHIDSWDLGTGAHDDGAGCMQTLGALKLLSDINYTPNYTLRFVFFINEENGNRGGQTYADTAIARQEHHLVAIESDAGAFTTRGFGSTCSEEQLIKLRSFLQYFNPAGIAYMSKGGGGVDISPLHYRYGTPMIGLITDSQRSFDLHHSELDVLSSVHPREMELGTAALASILYLIDRYGY